MKCGSPDCVRDVVAKGLCLMHYKRVRKTGTTENRVQERRPLADRFHEKYKVNDETGCWEWTGALTHGYGVINSGGAGKAIRAHRVAYELFVGPIPNGDGYHGTCVLHRCDNPPCVNPEHLFLGTNHDNVLDREAKERNRASRNKGNCNPAAKITESDVLAIRASNLKQRELAKLYGVTFQMISRIKRNKAWKHVQIDNGVAGQMKEAA